MGRLFIASLIALLSGCTAAQLYGDNAKAVLPCQSAAHCDVLWGKAERWLTQNNYRLAGDTKSQLSTLITEPRDIDRAAYTVTKETTKDGAMGIAVRCETTGNIWGAFYDPAPPANRLFYYLLDQYNK